MPLQVTCQGCRKSFRVEEHLAGKKVRCPVCKGTIEIPGVSGDNAAVEPAAPARVRDDLVRGRTQRDYTHLPCGGSTTVDGPEFEALADPLAGMVATYCSHCEEVFPLDQFAWTDTREKVTDYYARYRNSASPLQNFLASRLGMYALAAVPFLLALIGFLVSRNVWFVPSGLLLALIVIALHTVFLGPWILKQALGTSDARELR